LGQMCTCVAYRPPAYLAKVAATVDVISGGRVEMGIGAGWYEHEYAGYGYEFLSPAGRIAQLREAIEIMKRLWTEDEVHYEGRRYRLAGAICRPRPLQTPHMPIWVAGGGEQLTLRVAARHASYTNFGGPPDDFARRSRILAEHCREVGTDFEAIVRSTNFFVICRETEAEVADALGVIKERYRQVVPEDQAERATAVYRSMAGTPEQLVERLRPWAEVGLGYAISYFPLAAYDTTDLELFARMVMPEYA
ncbi:MAG: LLM class flavin-dependent oxidoreductase, partial [Acidimicrobiia bacterium]|nr:LLM class flavin-dependent oxidoreductase [Acidimicrobiia bacterium]